MTDAVPDDVIPAGEVRKMIDKRMSEKRFQAQVVELAQKRGWLVYHTYDSRRSEEGFPDLVMVRPPRLIFAELKKMGGEVSDEQTIWLNALLATRITVWGTSDSGDERWTPLPEVYVWYPSDWDRITQTLS